MQTRNQPSSGRKDGLGEKCFKAPSILIVSRRKKDKVRNKKQQMKGGNQSPWKKIRAKRRVMEFGQGVHDARRL